jgi:O-antigen ligase
LERAGVLRPEASLGNSIVLGYAMMVSVGCYLFLMSHIANGWRRTLGLVLLAGGVIWSLSRGPWTGLCFLVLVFLFTGTKVVSRLLKALVIGAFALLILLQFPLGQFLFDLLPFIGKSETGSVDYREDLLTQALPVIYRNLWFGSTNFLSAPEFQTMYSGGIIDVVNTYLAVALQYGIVGFIFFTGAFFFATLSTLQALRRAKRVSDDSAMFGRTLLAVLLSIMLVIYTVSSIGAVPLIYWVLIGVCVAYHQMVMSQAVRVKVIGGQL